MNDSITEGVSRRRLIGGMTALAGVTSAAMLLSPGTAHADIGQGDTSGLPNAVPTGTQPGLRYGVLTGYEFHPLDSTQAYTSGDGAFRFTGASSGWARLQMQLPVGAVIREVEVYGNNLAGTARAQLWKTDSNNFGATLITEATTAAAGAFTLTFTTNTPVALNSKPTVFVNLPTGTAVYGCRIGYTVPSPFVPFAGANPRVYDTRAGGLTKLAANEERIISLGLPPGIGAAVLTLTLSATEGGGGYVAVFNADTATWPGNSSVNWSAPGQDIANTVVTPVSADGKIKIRGGANKTNVIIDVTGHIV